MKNTDFIYDSIENTKKGIKVTLHNSRYTFVYDSNEKETWLTVIDKEGKKTPLSFGVEYDGVYDELWSFCRFAQSKMEEVNL